jgi:hypothetical protein
MPRDKNAVHSSIFGAITSRLRQHVHLYSVDSLVSTILVYFHHNARHGRASVGVVSFFIFVFEAGKVTVGCCARALYRYDVSHPSSQAHRKSRAMAGVPKIDLVTNPTAVLPLVGLFLGQATWFLHFV